VAWTAAPKLRALLGVGPDSAAALLIAAGDNWQRLNSEAAFAALCGASPVEASSGKTRRHRLNRGGDRQANAALHRIVIVRLRWHQPTRDYATRRTTEGKTKKEITRCLKRYVAREVFAVLHQIGEQSLTTAA
jgi:transposase